MRIITLILLFHFAIVSYSQMNCNIFAEGSDERKACEVYNEALTLIQGSEESQIMFDKAIELNPNLSVAYEEKSVPYFKRGFLLDGLRLLNKAVEIDPASHLCYRAYWYFQYKNYELCAKDLEKYYSLPNSYDKLTPGGDTSMSVLLAISYAKLGDLEKGIQTMLNHINSENFDSDYYQTDFHVMGVLYFENGDYNNALDYFNRQFEVNDNYADTYYYTGLVHKYLLNLTEAKRMFLKSKEIFNTPNRLLNAYLCFRVYEPEVDTELKNL